MAARKKVAPKPTEVVDAEFVETTPVAPVPKARVAKAAKPVVEAEVVEADNEETETAEDVEPAVDELQEVAAEVEVPEVAVKVKAARGTGLARQDPLASYMAEVTKHSLLTREEEVSLAKRYRDTGDVKAAYKLVASNLRLVVKLADRKSVV